MGIFCLDNVLSNVQPSLKLGHRKIIMVIWDEKLADILEDGNARRGWWMDLRRQEEQSDIRLIDWLIESLKKDLNASEEKSLAA